MNYDIIIICFFRGVNNRTDNCQVSPDHVARLRQRRQQMNSLNPSTMEQFASATATSGYHANGHMYVSECNGVPNQSMAYAEMSARDPLFWQWHYHMDLLYKEASDKIMGR